MGAIVALLPLLGFPGPWESFFQVVAGLSIVGLSFWAQIDRKISQKAKAQMRSARKIISPSAEAGDVAPLVPPVTIDHGKRVTDFYPKTGQLGRRLSDIKPAPSADVPEEILN